MKQPKSICGLREHSHEATLMTKEKCASLRQSQCLSSFRVRLTRMLQVKHRGWTDRATQNSTARSDPEINELQTVVNQREGTKKE